MIDSQILNSSIYLILEILTISKIISLQYFLPSCLNNNYNVINGRIFAQSAHINQIFRQSVWHFKTSLDQGGTHLRIYYTYLSEHFFLYR